jgi:protein TIF31
MMKQVAEKMNLQVNKIIDGADKEVEIAGCVEIKGIRGTDKRCYIVDLQGMTPRDANYLGEENHTCLIRQELIILYQRQKNLENAKAKMEDYEKVLEKEKEEREPKIEEGSEPTEEYKKQMAVINQELNLKKIQKFEEYLIECKAEIYNTNVFKKVKLAMSAEELKVEEDKVLNLAKFLKEEAIQSLIKNLNRNEGVPTDSASLRDFFHQNGINIRYLGYIAEQIKEKNLCQMQYMIEREVIIRCIKHILNQYIRENESDELLGALISHIFNCLLAPKDFLKKLDDGEITYKPVTLQEMCEKPELAK